MAVTQWFTVGLAHDVLVEDTKDGQQLTLSRAQAESLCTDLGEALGLGSVQGPEIDAQALLAHAYGLFQDSLHSQTQDEEPVGRTMSTEEALARVQAQEQMVPEPPVRRNPGTGIGNG